MQEFCWIALLYIKGKSISVNKIDLDMIKANILLIDELNK